MKKTIRKTLFNAEIFAEANFLDEGISVIVTGGNKSHIGSISVAEADGSINTTTYPGHKDNVVGEHWARMLAKKYSCRVIVVCGIHYDNVTKDMIASIVETTDNMLLDLIVL